MSEFYQSLDAPHFDYQLAAVPGIAEHRFRGPVPNLDEPFFACIGGAQTFGRFCHAPYPTQLAAQLQLPCLNLGLGGAGPRFALETPVRSLLERAQFVIVQMFSGRSASNARFDNSSANRNYGRVVGTEEWVTFEQFLRDLVARGDRELLERTVQETREDYAHHSMALAQALPRPTVLLWLSRRTPEYDIDWQRPFGIMSHYPQLIDRATVDAIRPHYDHYAECGDAIGLPQRLWPADAAVDGSHRDEQGELWNSYYPTPEMHTAAAARLLPICRALLAPPRRPEGP